ncbi:MAG: leucine-rich repeat domain-containing protein, partial [Candidatus Poribacteria bacterium]|nr:leucine-rich repeat domain-containing protein [Candidatus Poribacteria bacterium]
MKLSIIKQRSTVFFFLTLLILFSTSNTGYGQAATIDPPLSERTPQVRDAIVAAVPGVNAAEDVTAAHLAAITRLDVSQKSITVLKSSDFSGLTALTKLYLYDNAISDISALEGLTNLTHLWLYDNTISDISPLIGLTNLTRLELYNNAISDISALGDLTSLTHLYLFDNTISDISTLENLTSLTELWLSDNAISDISALEDLTNLTNLLLNSNVISDTSPLENLTNLAELYLAGNQISDYGPVRRLKAAIEAAGSSIYIDVNIDNDPPAFTDGTNTTRSVAENAASGQNIGTAVAAADADNDTLIYILGGTDAASFSIISTSGQLQTSAALDFDTKSSYSVTVLVFDKKGGSDSITVTINITEVNEIDPPLSERTQQVCDAIVAAIPDVYNTGDVTAAHLAVITNLNLNSKGITSLKSGDFNGLTALTNLDLRNNSTSDISALEGLTTLTNLDLGNNSISDISAL